VPSLLIELFEKHSALYYLEDFVVKNSAETHGFISDESDMIEFIREPWKVPCVIPMESGNNTIVPFFSGKEMKWQLAK
jgi:dihydroorotase